MKGRHGHSTGKSLLEETEGIIVTFLCACCLCVAHPSALRITTFKFVNCLGFECFLFVSDCVQWRVYAFYIVVHTRADTRYGSYTVKWKRSEKYLTSEGNLKFIDYLFYLGVEK